MLFNSMRRAFSFISSLLLPIIVRAEGADLLDPTLEQSATTTEEKFRAAAGFKGTALGPGGVYAVVGTAINALLSLIGVAFLLLIVYGGVVLFQARGEESEVKKAQKIIEQGVIGLVIVLGAYAITKFVLNKFTGVTLQ